MERVLIAFEGNNGMTRDCAERLSRELNRTETVLWDLSSGLPDRTGFDLMVVGSNVRHGRLRPNVRKLLREESVKPDAVPIGIFLCCGFPDRFEEYRDRLIPRPIRERARFIVNFGGSLNPSGKPFWDRVYLFFSRSAVIESEIDDGEYTPVLPGMIPENICQIAEEIRKNFAGKPRNR